MAFWKGTERLANWLSPYTKRETGVNELTTAVSLCVVCQEECMLVCYDATKIIESKLDDTQGGFRCCRSTTEQISTPSNFREILGACQRKTSFGDLGKVWKVYCRVSREKFCGCCGGTLLTGASCWPSSNCIPAQKIVSVSTEVNHNRSALVLDIGNGVCCHHSSVYISALYTTAGGPNPTCEAIPPGRNTFCQ